MTKLFSNNKNIKAITRDDVTKFIDSWNKKHKEFKLGIVEEKYDGDSVKLLLFAPILELNSKDDELLSENYKKPLGTKILVSDKFFDEVKKHAKNTIKYDGNIGMDYRGNGVYFYLRTE